MFSLDFFMESVHVRLDHTKSAPLWIVNTMLLTEFTTLLNAANKYFWQLEIWGKAQRESAWCRKSNWEENSGEGVKFLK